MECAKCARHREANAERRQRLMSQQLCIVCGGPARPRARMCLRCAQVQNAHNRASYARRRGRAP